MIRTYFDAERSGAAVFMIVGLVAIVIAAWGWRQDSFWRGAAWPLAAAALIQIGVGLSVWVNSPRMAQHAERLVATETVRVAQDEITRMRTVMSGFVVNRRIELGLMIVGLAVFFFARRGSGWQGAGVALAAQAGLIFVLDGFAERRAQIYLDWLLTRATTPAEPGRMVAQDAITAIPATDVGRSRDA